ncbi:hypothetical protein AYO21_02039 [Fonsecaea monophora]|uniref:Transcription factor domain-containing protein n=1 Tax=Fonsecaea monophora TaxID=254056 RepID=A0A177FKB0_9EURO|nr:hypothetical protein AYO21_02039 [Fonsecaea monophora]OAG43812.1 hypothetical protein AYO21_02039 [Fonsecaea monophora]
MRDLQPVRFPPQFRGFVSLFNQEKHARCWSFTVGYPATAHHPNFDMFMPHHDEVGYLPTPDSGRQAGCDTDVEVSNAFESLMALASTISDAQLRSKSASASKSYLNDVAMDRQLSEWYERLPAALKWSRGNLKHAGPSFLFLHQQYHYVAITLHQSCATTGRNQTGSDEDVGNSTRAALELSRNICYDHSMRLIQALELSSGVCASPVVITSTLHHIQTAASAVVHHLRLYNDHTAATKPLQTLLRLAQLDDETNNLARSVVKYIEDALNDSSRAFSPDSQKPFGPLRLSEATGPFAPQVMWRGREQLTF